MKCARKTLSHLRECLNKNGRHIKYVIFFFVNAFAIAFITIFSFFFFFNLLPSFITLLCTYIINCNKKKKKHILFDNVEIMEINFRKNVIITL